MRADRVLAPAVFAVLVIATLAAFAAAQRLKREPLVLDKLEMTTVITPNGDGRKDVARISFRLSVEDRASVQIIDRSDRPVRTLAFATVIGNHGRRYPLRVRNAQLPSYKELVFHWNGRTVAGRIAATGPYRLRVRLFGEDRTLIPPSRIRLHTLRRVRSSGASAAQPEPGG